MCYRIENKKKRKEKENHDARWNWNLMMVYDSKSVNKSNEINATMIKWLDREMLMI